MKKFTSPFVLSAPHPITSARLESRMHLGAATHIELDVANGVPAAGQATLTAPAGSFPVCSTPMRLRIASQCGCWSMLVDVPDCQPPTAPGTFDGDGGAVDPIPSGCEETPEPTPVTLTVDVSQGFFVISPSPVRVGDTGTVTVTMKNISAVDYTGTTTITVPSGFTETSFNVTGSLAAGQTKTWTIGVTANAAGTWTTTATANGVTDSATTEVIA